MVGSLGYEWAEVSLDGAFIQGPALVAVLIRPLNRLAETLLSIDKLIRRALTSIANL